VAIRIALIAVPAVAVAGLVLLLNGLDTSAGIAVAAFGLIAVATGTALGYFADQGRFLEPVARRRSMRRRSAAALRTPRTAARGR